MMQQLQPSRPIVNPSLRHPLRNHGTLETTTQPIGQIRSTGHQQSATQRNSLWHFQPTQHPANPTLVSCSSGVPNKRNIHWCRLLWELRYVAWPHHPDDQPPFPRLNRDSKRPPQRATARRTINKTEGIRQVHWIGNIQNQARKWWLTTSTNCEALRHLHQGQGLIQDHPHQPNQEIPLHIPTQK